MEGLKSRLFSNNTRRISRNILSRVGLKGILPAASNARIQREREALIWAIQENDLPWVKLLTGTGVSVDFKLDGGLTPLEIAIDKRNNDIIKNLLKKGANPNNKDDNGFTPLMRAIRDNSLSIAEILLNKGADINLQDNEGKTALIHAVEYARVDIVKELLDKGADPNIQDNAGRTALIFAVLNEKFDIVKELLDKGANPNIQDSEGNTALILAVEQENVNIVTELLNKGANPNIQDGKGANALIFAVDSGNMDIVTELLNKGADPNIQDNKGNTALKLAFSYRDDDTINMLLDKGADINIWGDYDETIWALALHMRNFDIFKKLLNKGVDINSKDKYGNTILNEVIDWGNFNMFKELLNRGVDINIKDDQGKTVLMKAVNTQNIDIFKELLNKGVDINVQDNEGKTALMYAVLKRRIDTLEELLNKGADIHIQDNQGKTALIHAIEMGFIDIAKELLQKGADINIQDNYVIPLFMNSVDQGNIDMVGELLNRGVDINVQDNKGKTALIHSINATLANIDIVKFIFSKDSNTININMVKYLLNKGANLNIQDNEGKTVLIYAVIEENIDIIIELLNKGADLNIQDNEGKTALIHSIELGLVDITKEMLNRGVDITIKDNQGKSALIYAIELGRVGILKEFLRRGVDINVKNNQGKSVLTLDQQVFINKIVDSEAQGLIYYQEDPALNKYISCKDELETLHQFSGQCWNDANMIYLWFSSGIGEQVQKALQQPYIVYDFQIWLNNEEVKKQIIGLFPYVKNHYDYFVNQFEIYFRCMKERYELWASLDTLAHSKPEKGVHRQLSGCYSKCGERTGIEIGSLLAGDVSFRFYNNKMGKTIQKRLNEAKEKLKSLSSTQDYTSIIEDISRGAPGFNPTKFTNVNYILLQFLLKGNVDLYIYLNYSTLAEKVPQSDFYDTVINMETNAFNNSLNQKKSLLFKDIENINSVYEPFQFKSILGNISDTYHVSFVVAVRLIRSTKSHAISLMTCPDGGYYLYDDNSYVLAKINWPLLFKGMQPNINIEVVNPLALYNAIGETEGWEFIYIPHSSVLPVKEIFQIPIPQRQTASSVAYPVLIRIKWKNVLNNNVLEKKDASLLMITKDDFKEHPVEIDPNLDIYDYLKQYGEELYVKILLSSVLCYNPNKAVTAQSDHFSIQYPDKETKEFILEKLEGRSKEANSYKNPFRKGGHRKRRIWKTKNKKRLRKNKKLTRKSRWQSQSSTRRKYRAKSVLSRKRAA